MNLAATIRYLSIWLLTLTTLALLACSDSTAVREKIEAAKARNDGPAIFKVTDIENESSGILFVFGTISVVPANMNFAQTRLSTITNDSGRFIFIMPSDESADRAFAELVNEEGYLNDEQTLSSMLPNILQKRVIAFALNNDLPSDYFEKHSPWFAAVSIAAYSANTYYDSDDVPLKPIVMARAISEQKAIIFLDTPAEAFARDSSGTRTEQIELLDTALSEQLFPKIEYFDAWLRGDLQEIENKLFSIYGNETPQAVLRLKRQQVQDWTPKLNSEIQSGGTVTAFIPVEFLIGEENLLDALRDQGLTVERYNHADKGPVLKTIDLSIDPNKD